MRTAERETFLWTRPTRLDGVRTARHRAGMPTPRPARFAWLPNALTWARIGLAPVVLGAYAAAHGGLDGLVRTPATWRIGWLSLAVGAFGLAALLDGLDGWLARRLRATSALGAALDPAADKLLALAAMLALLSFGANGLYATHLLAPCFVILARDGLVSALRAHTGFAAAPPSRLAKWKTAVEFFSLGGLLASPLLVLGAGGASLALGGLAGLWLAAGLSVLTGVSYARHARRRPG
ncbi:MAG: CDP-alcohol phosphatidyltransferase family protein [Maricaulaceae bacterium]